MVLKAKRSFVRRRVASPCSSPGVQVFSAGFALGPHPEEAPTGRANARPMINSAPSRRMRPRGGTHMNDRDRRESGRLMLISPERVFYAGLLGRPRQRSSGGTNIYCAMQGQLRITFGKSEVTGEVALVPPYVPHGVESDCPSIICL